MPANQFEVEYRRLLDRLRNDDPTVLDAIETRSRGPLAGATEADIERAIEEAITAPVTGSKRPKIEGRPVPTRRPGRLDIDDIIRGTGETQRAAVDRVLRVIGQRIDQTPLCDAWNAARDRVLANRSLSNVTREEMLREGGLYDRVRNAFWDEVRARGDTRQFVEASGFEFRQQRAPFLRVSSPAIPDEEIRLSLDHIQEKAIGDNWRHAIDADNLRFEFQNPNSFREIVQRRHQLRNP